MAHPWFYATKNVWYVKIGNKKIALGVKGEKNEADALKAWRKLIANGIPEPRAKATVKVLIDGFLTDAEAECRLAL